MKQYFNRAGEKLQIKTNNFFFVCVDNFGFQVLLKKIMFVSYWYFYRRTFFKKLSIVNL